MQQKQWQYGMVMVFGALLLIMPWLLKFHDDLPVRSWDFYVIGVVVIAAGAAGLHRRSHAAAWITPALGLWMVASPWLLGFMPVIHARNSAWVLGGALFLMSLWALLERRSAGRTRFTSEQA